MAKSKKEEKVEEKDKKAPAPLCEPEGHSKVIKDSNYFEKLEQEGKVE